MVAAFALREVAVDHRHIAEGGRNFRHDDAALGLFAIVGEAAAYGDRRLFSQQRHAVVPFLTVVEHVVPELCHLFERKHVVVYFGFL